MICDFIKTQTIKDTLNLNRILMVNINLEYPMMSGYDYTTSRFNMYYKQRAHRSSYYARIKLYPQAVKQYQFAKSQNFPFNAYELVQAFETTYCKKPIISLYYDQYEYTGGAHGNTVRTGNTWDLNKASLINLSDLFAKDYDYKKVIIKAVEAEAQRRKISGKVDYFDNLNENIVKFYDDKNFYLSENGVVVFYPLYTIAPYVAGIQTFTVPWLLFGNSLKIKP